MIPAGENPDQTELRCAICAKVYDRKFELKSHLSRHFGLNIFLCPVCGRQFSHSSNLSRHLRIHSGAKPYKCKDCGRRFNQANSLHTHRAYIHAGHNKRHGCPLCGRLYKTLQLLKRHCKINHQDENFECKECGMAFAWKSTYVKHTMQFHSSEPPIVMSCNEPDCGKEYKSLSQLQEHIKRDHQMIRRFSCDECNKQFYKAHDLLVHKRTHSKEKPYMCGTCGKSFSHISHVIRHEKSHNNIRPHTCPVCHKSFTQATVLRAHRYVEN
ncbi:hypothetical protein DAPPUDRAFT_41368 [Daphnia pulex]|uniref:C2H2-type domain-containing protein n=1 Tax=Daphnia pulex TaxID=6669 RepID=E9FUH6_DAPPU|nr:hypothetical protein DAPPUDRAFT_41368 [Daphnia pulex]|eukprot:EFX88730.1 hypothetical protein DAPPUDRAFT_41368 [Daphnia pulex]